MPSDDEFANRLAVVTGGSEGLGLDFCRQLTQRGCTVHFCARNPERGASAARDLGPLAHFHQADIGDPAQIRAFAESVAPAGAPIDYLVNNVAIDDRIAFDDVTEENADHQWHVNLRSTLLTTRAFLGAIRRGAGKSIVNIVTTNYLFGLENFTLYNATKSGIVGFTRSLARELGKEGIRANMVSPGWIMTEKQLREYVTQQDKADLIRDQALKFLVTPADVTPAVLFLLSHAARAVTGQNLVVDAGRFMQ